MAETISDLLLNFLRDNNLEKPMLEHRMVELWPQVMGEQIARLTGKMEIKNGTLIVHIHSAALRMQLFECRNNVIKKLNDAVQAQVINDIRFLG